MSRHLIMTWLAKDFNSKYVTEKKKPRSRQNLKAYTDLQWTTLTHELESAQTPCDLMYAGMQTSFVQIEGITARLEVFYNLHLKKQMDDRVKSCVDALASIEKACTDVSTSTLKFDETYAELQQFTSSGKFKSYTAHCKHKRNINGLLTIFDSKHEEVVTAVNNCKQKEDKGKKLNDQIHEQFDKFNNTKQEVDNALLITRIPFPTYDSAKEFKKNAGIQSSKITKIMKLVNKHEKMIEQCKTEAETLLSVTKNNTRNYETKIMDFIQSMTMVLDDQDAITKLKSSTDSPDKLFKEIKTAVAFMKKVIKEREEVETEMNALENRVSLIQSSLVKDTDFDTQNRQIETAVNAIKQCKRVLRTSMTDQTSALLTESSAKVHCTAAKTAESTATSDFEQINTAIKSYLSTITNAS